MAWVVIVIVLGAIPHDTGMKFDSYDACHERAREIEAGLKLQSMRNAETGRWEWGTPSGSPVPDYRTLCLPVVSE